MTDTEQAKESLCMRLSLPIYFLYWLEDYTSCAGLEI